jgi:hypothetical protein
MQSNFQEKDNVIRNKSFDFSIRIINLYKILYKEMKKLYQNSCLEAELQSEQI